MHRPVACGGGRGSARVVRSARLPCRPAGTVSTQEHVHFALRRGTARGRTCPRRRHRIKEYLRESFHISWGSKLDSKVIQIRLSQGGWKKTIINFHSVRETVSCIIDLRRLTIQQKFDKSKQILDFRNRVVKIVGLNENITYKLFFRCRFYPFSW